MSLVWDNRIKVCRPAKAKQTGPNRAKMLKKRDFISNSTINEPTPVDIANRKFEFNRFIRIIRGE